MKKNEKKIDFGFKTININKKNKLVNDIFTSVSSKYDLMNDINSLGLHRYWKYKLINWLAPQPHQSLLDVAGGTGDIAKYFIESGGLSADIIDVNFNMLKKGLKRTKNIRHIVGNCEKLPISSNIYDRVTISFGLRNVTKRSEALKEIYRVLKPGGRFICLEFSHVENKLLKTLYDKWSFSIIPKFGNIIANDMKSYQYLVESIRMFPDKDKLSSMLSDANFSRIKYKLLSGGIVCLHSGWKI